jgi:hypothetical protein
MQSLKVLSDHDEESMKEERLKAVSNAGHIALGTEVEIFLALEDPGLGTLDNAHARRPVRGAIPNTWRSPPECF